VQPTAYPRPCLIRRQHEEALVASLRAIELVEMPGELIEPQRVARQFGLDQNATATGDLGVRDAGFPAGRHLIPKLHQRQVVVLRQGGQEPFHPIERQ
jgi:hypothetical protein